MTNTSCCEYSFKTLDGGHKSVKKTGRDVHQNKIEK